MKYRKLRIAWSVVWGIAAVLLIVLWVRSYWLADSIYVGLAIALCRCGGHSYCDAWVSTCRCTASIGCHQDRLTRTMASTRLNCWNGSDYGLIE